MANVRRNQRERVRRQNDELAEQQERLVALTVALRRAEEAARNGDAGRLPPRDRPLGDYRTGPWPPKAPENDLRPRALEPADEPRR